MADPFKSFKEDVENEARKTADSSWDSPFHTLGRGATQAAPGNHTHPASEIKDLPPGTSLSNAIPKISAGSGSAGVGTAASRDDHVHPPPPGINLATNTPPADSGTGAVGTSGNAAREDHQHPAHNVGYADNAGNAANADTVDGKHAVDFATSGHTHDYSPSSHTHNDYVRIVNPLMEERVRIDAALASGETSIDHYFAGIRRWKDSRKADEWAIGRYDASGNYVEAAVSILNTTGTVNVKRLTIVDDPTQTRSAVPKNYVDSRIQAGLASGSNYVTGGITVTFPIAFPAGVVPIVTVVSQASESSTPLLLMVHTVTNTSFKIKMWNPLLSPVSERPVNSPYLVAWQAIYPTA